MFLTLPLDNKIEEAICVPPLHHSGTAFGPHRYPGENPMSFQAYLDTIEKKTSKTPRQLLNEATEKGFGPETRATPIIEWLKEDYGLGRGHAMAMVHVITKGDQISDKHVGTGGTHSDASIHLWLDGKDSIPADW